MGKVKIIALKCFEYGGEVRTEKSDPFEVLKDEFLFFEANGMAKEVKIEVKAQTAEKKEQQKKGK